MFIRGEKVLLRPIQPADLPKLVAWSNDPEVARYLEGEYPKTLEEYPEWHRRGQSDRHSQHFAIATHNGSYRPYRARPHRVAQRRRRAAHSHRRKGFLGPGLRHRRSSHPRRACIFVDAPQPGVSAGLQPQQAGDPLLRKSGLSQRGPHSAARSRRSADHHPLDAHLELGVFFPPRRSIDPNARRATACRIRLR